MCGIAGIVEKNKDNNSLMGRMLDSIAHRGPDASSIYSWEDFTLGHRRLSIIDIEGGKQPMLNRDKSLAIIFNGEIYNYKELKRKQENKGYLFQTDSDTEVILSLYETYGQSFLNMLNGIFAFAILDKRHKRLFIARDYFGIKPLHYLWKSSCFIFGSEQKSILLHPNCPKNINKNSLHKHINLRYTPGQETLFEGIKRLAPAHYGIYENGKFETYRYWKLEPEIDYSIKEDFAKEEINRLVLQAVKRQLVSDVPIGVYLSGGLDSSAIVQKMHLLGVKDINTFTLGFNEPTDEFPDAEQIAKFFNTNHHTHSLSLNPMVDMPKVIRFAEEPKINLLQGYHMSKFVKSTVKVVLGGLGGDELFAGYDIHKFIYPFNKLHKHTPDWLKNILKIKSNILFSIQNRSRTLRFDEYRRGAQMLMAIGDIERFYLIIRNAWDYDNAAYRNIYTKSYINNNVSQINKTHKEFDDIFKYVKDANSLQQVLYTEFHTKMCDDYLLTNDRMSMANGVEERVPFLDRDLVEFGFKIPVNMKIKHNTTKALFREAMAPYLPPQIISKKKWGFTVNPYLQFKKDLKSTAEKILTKEYVREQGIFNYEYINRILNYPANAKLRWHYNYIWIIMGFAIWQEMFINGNNSNEIEAYYN